MTFPELWTRQRLDELHGFAAAWVTPSVRARVAPDLPFPILETGRADGYDTLIAIGGGRLLDQAKAWKADAAGRTVIAVPSLWGSGADASPIAVLQSKDGTKKILVGAELLPDARIIWPELAESVPLGAKKAGCGDAWSHAIEGFASPLAAPELRRELADLMQRMLGTSTSDPTWFQLAAEAANGQARSSVGLVHGLAHTLERHCELGHAQLCATFLLPVLEFNLTQSDRMGSLLTGHGVELNRVLDVAHDLFDLNAYKDLLPIVSQDWKSVLRDPCTRTNCALVRPGAASFFQEFRYAR